MAPLLLAIAGIIWLLLGTYHLLLTLRDIGNPRAFTPTDASVRMAMQGAQLRLNPRINLWDSWLGFNLSHSMGVMMFGGALVFISWAHMAAFSQSAGLRALAVLVPAAYLAVALRFWFWGPALGLSLSLVCIIGALFL